MTFVLSLFYLILFLLVLWALWKSGTKSLLFWIITPVFVFAMGYSWIVYESLRGWPYDAYPENDSEFHAAIIDKPNIYILVWPKESEEPRLLVIPHSEENEQKVTEAQQSKQSGQAPMTRNDSDGDFQFYNFNMQEMWKK